jgi:hypothetical protein
MEVILQLEADGRGELGRDVVEGLRADHCGPLRRVDTVPEEVAVAVGAELGVGSAVRLRAKPAAAAAGAVGAHVPSSGWIGDGGGGQAVNVGEGVAQARQLEAGKHGLEGAVEAGGDPVHAVGAGARGAEHAHPWHAPHQTDVDDSKLPRAKIVQRRDGGRVAGDETPNEGVDVALLGGWPICSASPAPPRRRTSRCCRRRGGRRIPRAAGSSRRSLPWPPSLPWSTRSGAPALTTGCCSRRSARIYVEIELQYCNI